MSFVQAVLTAVDSANNDAFVSLFLRIQASQCLFSLFTCLDYAASNFLDAWKFLVFSFQLGPLLLFLLTTGGILYLYAW